MYILPVGMIISVMLFLRRNAISGTGQHMKCLVSEIKISTYLDLPILIKSLMNDECLIVF